MIRPPRFSQQDADAAHEAWGCNCGPAALAAIAGLTLDEVRPHMGDFERKGYTNPTLMFAALDSIGARYHRKATLKGSTQDFVWPSHGLARIQWGGPWMEPGVPERARYGATHWVAAGEHNGGVGVFDVNCINNGSGWVSLRDWSEIVVPFLLSQCVPRADGTWLITHAIEIEPRGAA